MELKIGEHSCTWEIQFVMTKFLLLKNGEALSIVIFPQPGFLRNSCNKTNVASYSEVQSNSIDSIQCLILVGLLTPAFFIYMLIDSQVTC